MRILIISDIHANVVALETVLTDAGSFDRLWCLGDTIGYGPKPNECIVLMQQAEYAISGNHDLACIGKLDLEDFNPDARTANEWNGKQLTPENHRWLERLYVRNERLEEHPYFAMAHGSPREPIWEYLLTVEQALANFHDPHFQTQICFIGHSHIPVSFSLDDYNHCDRWFPDHRSVLDLEPDTRYIINPGSVGQPRNHDPRAAYAILDTDAMRVYFYRVAYDIPKTQEQMRAVKLPPALIRRLSVGM